MIHCACSLACACPVHLAECDHGALPISVSMSCSCQPYVSQAMRSAEKFAIMYSCPWSARSWSAQCGFPWPMRRIRDQTMYRPMCSGFVYRRSVNIHSVGMHSDTVVSVVACGCGTVERRVVKPKHFPMTVLVSMMTKLLAHVCITHGPNHALHVVSAHVRQGMTRYDKV